MSEYEDYIVNTPERAILIPEEISRHTKEHKALLHGLTKGNMTVKEIHELYKLPNGKYSKTLKTVYRHLETLEELKLVMVAGHRKYEGKRTLEKLYSRTAKIFFIDHPSKKEEWLGSEEGQKMVEMITEVVWNLNGKKGEAPSELQELVKQYFEHQQKYTTQMIQGIINDKDLSDRMDKYNFDEIAHALDVVPGVLILANQCDEMKRIKEILS